MIKLYPSFSGIIFHILRSKEMLVDDENSYYFFQCTREGIERTFQAYDRRNEFNHEALMVELTKAEKAGRLRWRVGDLLSAEEITERADRARWLSSVLDIPFEDLMKTSYYDDGIYHHLVNLPAIREFFSVYPNIQLIGAGG